MKHSILFQRIESAAFLIAVIIQYNFLHGSWLMFLLLFFVPDVSAIGYAINKRIGAIIYNIGHSITIPIFLSTLGYVHNMPTMRLIGIIWLAHITLDRAAGFGLKDFEGFHHTHLGIIGKAKFRT